MIHSKEFRFAVLLIVSSLFSMAAPAGEIHVPADYPTIQQAIDAAIHGDSVIVAPDTYIENIDFKGKAVTLQSEGGPSVTVIDGNRVGRGVTFKSGETPASVLDGFTITNGYEASGNGGGIDCTLESSPTIKNCVLSNNEAYALGGGIACRGMSRPVISKCTFINNAARGYYDGAYGGGLACFILGDATVTDCLFIGNESSYGGAIDCGVSFPVITNCLFAENMADKGGGAISCSASDPVITNCTSVNNYAAFGGGLALTGVVLPSYPVLSNCILWNDYPNEIQVLIGSPTVRCCDVEGGWPGTGNIDEDPLFAAPFQGDYHLTFPSPCRDWGDNSALPPGITLDFEGDPRKSNGTVDLGMDEFHTHLYTLGDATPGGAAQIKFTGQPGAAPVFLFIGSGVLDPPLPTPWGDWYLEFPFAGPIDLGIIPVPDGVLTLSGVIPAVPPAPYDLPMEGLIGMELTNLCVLEVR